MLQYLVRGPGGSDGDLSHPHPAGPVRDPSGGRPATPCRALWAVALLLLAPLSLMAQDRATVQATATVLPAAESQAALAAALRLTGAVPASPDSARKAPPPLADLRVRRPGPPGDATVVVSIEFLHN